jgi:hypothetical protein
MAEHLRPRMLDADAGKPHSDTGKLRVFWMQRAEGLALRRLGM